MTVMSWVVGVPIAILTVRGWLHMEERNRKIDEKREERLEAMSERIGEIHNMVTEMRRNFYADK